MTAAAFSGDYTDLRFIKTRSMAAITVEIPIEQASAFVAAFGAPMPGTGIPVAIARLDPEKAVSAPEPLKERRSWSDLSYAQQAGIRCNEPDFWEFINELAECPPDTINSPEGAASFVRVHCGVKSRAQITVGSLASNNWLNLNDKYEAWQREREYR